MKRPEFTKNYKLVQIGSHLWYIWIFFEKIEDIVNFMPKTKYYAIFFTFISNVFIIMIPILYNVIISQLHLRRNNLWVWECIIWLKQVNYLNLLIKNLKIYYGITIIYFYLVTVAFGMYLWNIVISTGK